MDWLVNFLSPCAVLVVWVDAQKPEANESLRTSGDETRLRYSCAAPCMNAVVRFLARRSQDYPVQKAGVAARRTTGIASKGNPDGQAEGTTRHYSRVDGTCARETTIRPAGTGVKAGAIIPPLKRADWFWLRRSKTAAVRGPFA